MPVARLLGVPFLRRFETRDRDDLYVVCLRTGDDGNDATGQYTVDTLLGEVYVGPYLAFEPDLAWVVDNDGVASGYVLCAPDTAAFEERCEQEWWPALRERYSLGAFAEGTTDAEVVEIIHRPHRTEPGILTDFPAHLHIDLLPEVQGKGFGGELIEALLDELIVRGVAGVHLGVSTANVRAIGFYEHLGFRVLSHDAAGTVMGKPLALV